MIACSMADIYLGTRWFASRPCYSTSSWPRTVFDTHVVVPFGASYSGGRKHYTWLFSFLVVQSCGFLGLIRQPSHFLSPEQCASLRNLIRIPTLSFSSKSCHVTKRFSPPSIFGQCSPTATKTPFCSTLIGRCKKSMPNLNLWPRPYLLMEIFYWEFFKKHDLRKRMKGLMHKSSGDLSPHIVTHWHRQVRIMIWEATNLHYALSRMSIYFLQCVSPKDGSLECINSAHIN